MRTVSAREAIDAILHELRTEIHTCFPARVLVYDAAEQTVDVRPALLREVPTDDDPTTPWGYDQLPDLHGIQIMWPRAGGFAITFPIAVGDWVLVHCAEQSTMVWRDKGDAPSHPGVLDPHGLNGCVAVPGWFPDKHKLADVDTEHLALRSTDNAVRIVLSGTEVRLGSTAGDDFVALAAKVDAELARIWGLLTGGGTPPAQWVPAANDGGAALKAAAIEASTGVESVAASMVKAK